MAIVRQLNNKHKLSRCIIGLYG